MSISPLPSKDQERGLALQKYLLLHSQHDALQKHLSQITPSHPNPTTTTPHTQPRHSSLSSSLSSSPSDNDEHYLASPISAVRHHQRSDSLPRLHPQRRPMLKTRRSSLPAVIDELTIEKMEEDESKLKNVNQQIKSTLTDLLNCASVRGDPRYRKWVQTRLMDAEQELKGNRSRSCEKKRRMSLDVGC